MLSHYDSPMQDKNFLFTALELVRPVFAVLLTVTQPHAGDAVAARAGKVSLLALLAMGN